MPTEIELLATLRRAAQDRDPNVGCEMLEALLPRLPVPTMLRLAHDEVRLRLPAFERHHPQMHWPRIWLDALLSGEPFTFDESTPEVLEEAPGPGGNNFTEAVQQLALAAAAEGNQRVKHATEAISGAIMADSTEVGGSKYRDLWDLWFQDISNHDESHERQYRWVLQKINNDPDVAAVEIAGWTRLADELAAALGVTG